MKINKPKFWDEKSLTFFSILLLPFSYLYSLLVTIKKLLKKKESFSNPVICVGNIYIGGTGKTPTVQKIANILRKDDSFRRKY